MQVKTKEMITRVKRMLVDNEYMRAKDIGKKIRLCPSSVCRIIRIMRIEGIGVHATNKGYVLSEYAHKPDDVNFLRRLNGRRTSDVIAISAAERHIRRRWRSIESQRELKSIIGPLVGSPLALQRSASVLLTYKNDKGL